MTNFHIRATRTVAIIASLAFAGLSQAKTGSSRKPGAFVKSELERVLKLENSGE